MKFFGAFAPSRESPLAERAEAQLDERRTWCAFTVRNETLAAAVRFLAMNAKTLPVVRRRAGIPSAAYIDDAGLRHRVGGGAQGSIEVSWLGRVWSDQRPSVRVSLCRRLGR